MAKIKTCWECGCELHLKRPGNFCCTAHRKDFNNRRLTRGAEIYDLFMELRYNRANGKAKGIWSEMCSRGSAYRDADKHYREGRQSWDSKAQQRLPQAWSDQGDKR